MLIIFDRSPELYPESRVLGKLASTASRSECEVRTRSHLGESNVFGILTEALSADVQSVLPDQSPVTRTNTAAERGLSVSDITSKSIWPEHRINLHVSLASSEA